MSTLCLPGVIYVISVPRSSLCFATLLLSCIILNTNQGKPGNKAMLLAPVIIVYMASTRSVHTMRKVTVVTSTSCQVQGDHTGPPSPRRPISCSQHFAYRSVWGQDSYLLQ